MLTKQQQLHEHNIQQQ